MPLTRVRTDRQQSTVTSMKRGTKLSLAMLTGASLLSGAALADWSTKQASAQYAMDSLSAQVKAADAAVIYTPKRVTDALPLVQYDTGSVVITESSLVATGRFVAWRPGSAFDYLHPVPEDGSGSLVPWDSPSAQAHTIESTFHIDAVMARNKDAGTASAGNDLQVVFFLQGPDPRRFGEGLLALGPAVAFLKASASNQKSEWSIAQDGALIGTVDTHGNITMKVDATSSDGVAMTHGLVVDVATIAQLRAAGSLARTIQVGQ